jgi:UDP-galactopyranose mutase
MNSRVDCLIVGAGLTGAVIARVLVDAGRSVYVVDRRPHLGGNVHDQVHPSGIRVHTYGPHYFRTSSDLIWRFVQRFGEFYRYEPALKSWVDGQYENWPIAAGYIRRTVGPGWRPEFVGKARNFEEAALGLMPRLIYEKFVRGYNEKQWGVPPRELAADLVKRFDVREDDEPRLARHKYQGLPVDGYAALMERMLDGIPVLLNCDYLGASESFTQQKWTVFTGSIDEFFRHDLGRLKYRGQERSHEYLENVDYVQPCGQVNNPGLKNGPHIRTLEWKHLMEARDRDRIRGTVLTREVTVTTTMANDHEYPFPDRANKELYEIYRARADKMPNLTICGRLGEYRYYDMDQAIGRAMKLGGGILDSLAVQEPGGMGRRL